MRDDDARQAILSRRARFIAATLASAGLLVSTADCGGQSTSDDKQATGGSGGIPQPCLSGGAQPCLGAPSGGGSGGTGGSPYPCLSGAGGWLGPDADVPDVSEVDAPDDSTAADADDVDVDDVDADGAAGGSG